VMNFYVSSVGGDIAQSIISIIRSSYPSAVIWGSDLHEEHAGYYQVDHFRISPSFDSEDFLLWVENLLRENSIEVYIPINEGELGRLADLSEDQRNSLLGSSNLIWAGELAVRVFGDKRKTSDFIQSAQLPVTKDFRKVDDIDTSDFPVLVKPNQGAGSRGVFKCNNARELEAALVFVEDPIIQEYLDVDNSEYTCAVFRAGSGVTKVLSLRRHLSGGMTSWAIADFNLTIDSFCRQLAEKIDLNGSINVQLRIVDGLPKIFEINGRFSSTLVLRDLLGFKDLLWSLGDLNGFDSFDISKNQGRIVYKSMIGNVKN
jgi:carbamoyl-phosphate synthase large subunit